MATGARPFRWCIAGPTTIASLAPRRISCRRTSRRSRGPHEETCAMVVTVIFMVVMAVLVGWGLSRQGLTAKPWLEAGGRDDARGAEPSVHPTAKIGLVAFLVVAGSLFSLPVRAYSSRNGTAGWASLA